VSSLFVRFKSFERLTTPSASWSRHSLAAYASSLAREPGICIYVCAKHCRCFSNTRCYSTVRLAMMADSVRACSLLDTPREIRDHIIGEVLFPGEAQPIDLIQNTRGTASTAVRQIHPYNTDEDKKPRFDVAIIRTCRQLQHEAEAVLYGSSSWNLMYEDWLDHDKVSYDFFEKLPRRLRKLIQRVERKCYSEPYWNCISLYDWKLFMTFLARECPNLHSLRLWGPGDRVEGPPWVRSCNKNGEWVKAILQIKSLRYFDIPVIPGGVIYDYAEFRDDFLPWLKSNITIARPALHKLHTQGLPIGALDFQDHYHSVRGHQPKANSLRNHSHSLSSPSEDALVPDQRNKTFPFLRLERSVRDLIYRHTLLPPGKRVHPYIKSWYDLTTRAVLPVFLTCKQLHNEAEVVLYAGGIFTAPSLQKYEQRMCRFLGGRLREPGTRLNPRLLAMIRHLSFGWHKVGQQRFFSIISRSMQLEHLEVVLSKKDVEYMNAEWLHRAINPKALWRAGYSGDFAMVSCKI